MNEIAANLITTATKSHFNMRAPAGLCCITVFDGIQSGKIFTDASKYTSGQLYGKAFLGLFYEGDVNPLVIRELIASISKRNKGLLSLWPDDLLCEFAGTDYDYENRVFYFYDRLQDRLFGINW